VRGSSSPLAPQPPLPGHLCCGRFKIALTRPLIMGVVNVTPDSFSDGGRFLETGPAVVHAREPARKGGDILDIGGESTRPAAQPVPVAQELDRILPVLDGLRGL